MTKERKLAIEELVYISSCDILIMCQDLFPQIFIKQVLCEGNWKDIVLKEIEEHTNILIKKSLKYNFPSIDDLSLFLLKYVNSISKKYTNPQYFLFHKVRRKKDGEEVTFTNEEGEMNDLIFYLTEMFYDGKINTLDLKTVLAFSKEHGMDADISVKEEYFIYYKYYIQIASEVFYIATLKGIYCLKKFNFHEFKNTPINRYIGSSNGIYGYQFFNIDKYNPAVFSHTLSEIQMMKIFKEINELHIFDEKINYILLEKIFTCKIDKPIVVKNIINLVTFFSELSNKKYIRSNWQDVIHKNQSFVGSRKAVITNRSLSSSLQKVNRANLVYIGIKKLVDSL